MNPPYSLKNANIQRHFDGFETPPKQYADYGFVLYGLSLLRSGGQLIAILPHGVLFRGNAERQIRKQLIEKNLIDCIIGLPNNLFLNTGIPVFLLIIKRDRETKEIYFVDASKHFTKGKPQNVMMAQDIKKVIDAVKGRECIAMFASPVSSSAVKDNDYNLNIPRYVDTFEQEPVPDLLETLQEMFIIDRQIADTEIKLFEMMNKLVGTNEKADRTLKEANKMYLNQLKRKYGAFDEDKR